MLIRYRGIGWAFVLGMGVLATVPVRAADIDGDGVDDAVDVCNNTPVGTTVDNQGRPLGDLDGDCDADSADYSMFAACLNGPNIPPAAECAGDADLDDDSDADAADYALFQGGFTGSVPQLGMVLIPAGQFQMGNSFSSGEGGSDELPPHAVYVDAFYMDTYEVTNQQYAAALNWAKSQNNLITVTGGVVYKYNSGTSYPYCDTTTSSTYSRITWNGNTFGVASGKENHSMVQVSWYGAVAYANWRSAIDNRPVCYDGIDESPPNWDCNFGSGYRLPTEAEWEKAARGGVSGHRFPWSDTDFIQHARANHYSWEGYSYDNSPTRGYHPTFNTGVIPYTSPVGYFAPNGYGLYDMAGNVWEWCNDWYSSTYYQDYVNAGSPPNPHGPTTAQTGRGLRGGGWYSFANLCRVAYRYISGTPGSRYGSYGFRLALDSE